MGRRLGSALRSLAAALGAVVVVLGLAAPAAADAGPEPAADDDEVVLTLFWGDGCPHCAAEKEWLAGAVEARRSR